MSNGTIFFRSSGPFFPCTMNRSTVTTSTAPTSPSRVGELFLLLLFLAGRMSCKDIWEICNTRREGGKLVTAKFTRSNFAISHCGTGGVCFSTPLLAIYVRYIVPLQLENHTFVIHLCDIYSTPAVGKLYLNSFVYGEICCTLRE